MLNEVKGDTPRGWGRFAWQDAMLNEVEGDAYGMLYNPAWALPSAVDFGFIENAR